MQLPIQTGVEVKDGAFRTAYPTNLRHKIVESGVSKGELVSTHGAREKGTGPGADRGGICWNGVHYRAMGDKLVSISADGSVTELGTLPNDGLLCRFTYGFDRLAIEAAQRLFYWNGSLSEVTDEDLGAVLDVAWIDGYFVTTDGESVVVTELNDPSSINPLKYGSAESDPDPVTGVAPFREELAVFGRHSIQFMQNVGSAGFPFANVRGAMIPYGAISAQAKCAIAGTLAFVGSARDEPLGVYLITQGTAVRISDEAIDAMVNSCGDHSDIVLEARRYGDEEHLLVHTTHCSAALAMRGSQKAEEALWHKLDSRGGKYRPRGAVWCHGAHWVGDALSSKVGVLDGDISAHFGEEPGWAFPAGLLYNEGRAFILHEAHLTGQSPRAEGAVFFSMTRDGETWSQEVALRLSGQRNQPVVWRPHVRVERLCGFKFRGHGKWAIARADVEAEPLAA